MFYSHEILTSRKYGVATVWLVATLGAKTTLKKINRKAILDVNIPKACNTVVDPGAPMALRLQSNLLYGISRVYSQQCMYILLDAQQTQTNIRALLKVIRTADLDPNAGKAKPEQLILQDDPAFMPDDLYPMMDLDMDFSMLDSSQGTLHTSSGASGVQHVSSQSSEGGLAIPPLDIPASGSSGIDLGPFEFPGSVPGSTSRRMVIETEDVGFLPDVDFNFDEEGNLVDLSAPIEPALLQSGALNPSDLQVTGNVLEQMEEGVTTGQQPIEDPMDFEFQIMQDEQQEDPAAEHPTQREERSTSVTEEGSEYADAPQRRKPKTKRKAREIPRDRATTIRNSELQRWNDEYPNMMREARQDKVRKQANAQAKRNAEFFVIGSGIGNCGIGIGPSKNTHPLAHLFSGQALFQALTDHSPSEDHPDQGSRQKRSRSPSSEATENLEARRVRARLEEGRETGRGEALGTLEDDAMQPLFDADQSIELARQAHTLLEDHSSQMPWNISSRGASRVASHVGSGQRSRAGSAVSGRPPSSAPHLPPSATSFDRRASRLPMPSPSPLVGRGSLPPAAATAGRSSSNGGVGDTGLLLGLPSGGATGDEEYEEALRRFELFGPGAAVSTQVAAQSQWVRDVLDQESGNFLGFVTTAIEDKARQGEGEAEAEGEGAEATAANVHAKDVTFEELLPPEKHSHIVAAQAFLHVLSLANRGVLSTSQETTNEAGEDVWWGKLWLGVLPLPEVDVQG